MPGSLFERSPTPAEYREPTKRTRTPSSARRGRPAARPAASTSRSQSRTRSSSRVRFAPQVIRHPPREPTPSSESEEDDEESSDALSRPAPPTSPTTQDVDHPPPSAVKPASQTAPAPEYIKVEDDDEIVILDRMPTPPPNRPPKVKKPATAPPPPKLARAPAPSSPERERSVDGPAHLFNGNTTMSPSEFLRQMPRVASGSKEPSRKGKEKDVSEQQQNEESTGDDRIRRLEDELARLRAQVCT